MKIVTSIETKRNGNKEKDGWEMRNNCEHVSGDWCQLRVVGDSQLRVRAAPSPWRRRKVLYWSAAAIARFSFVLSNTYLEASTDLKPHPILILILITFP